MFEESETPKLVSIFYGIHRSRYAVRCIDFVIMETHAIFLFE